MSCPPAGRLAAALLAAAAVVCAGGCVWPAGAQGTRDYISIVGSSTVYPFATVVAEQFGRGTRFKTPKIESTGSGGGLKLFCSGLGVQHPDVANSSRRITPLEVRACENNGVSEILEVKIGYDGIVLANANTAPRYALTLRAVYLALAKNVPDPAGDERLVTNPYRRWSDIDDALPDVPIEVLGPPPTSGTRDAFVELVMEAGCREFPFVAALDGDDFRAACHTMREDGAFVEAGENDNLIVQKLESNPTALGIFGYSFLEQNYDKVQGAMIDGIAPSFDAIASGRYTVSRPLYFYVKKVHIDFIPGIVQYLREFTSEEAMGEFGYLSDKGLIPLSEGERRSVLEDVYELRPLRLSAASG